MARKKEQKDGWNPIRDIGEETLQSVVMVIFFLASILLVLAAFGQAGSAGNSLYTWIKYLLGIGYFFLPILCVMLGIAFWRSLKQSFPVTKTIGSGLFFVAGLGITNIIFRGEGGVVGNFISSPLVGAVDRYAAFIILAALFVISLIIIFETQLTIDPIRGLIERLWVKKEKKTVKIRMPDGEEVEERMGEEEPEEAKEEPETEEEETAPAKQSKAKPLTKKEVEELEEEAGKFVMPQASLQAYVPPPLSLLERDKGKPVVGDIKANANIIKRTLQNFGINVEMDEISIGPSVTRYALKPAEGVKLSRIVALQNDLSLALAAHPIRIEAPIPGKSLVGIEIPNSTKSTVGLASLLSADDYQNSDKPLLVALGKGISGKSHFANIAKMPHLLIAGTTGSGKSVTIHAVITSLLFRNSMDNMKFIMIDPKRVELTLYNKIPHQLTPVITDPKKAILALKWAAKEMDRRYDILEAESVRDIQSYHKNIVEPAIKKAEEDRASGVPKEEIKLPELMPYIVIIIDELADLMTTYPREMEAAIVRLAQMSRAVGIHLIISTQRPSVNVITGLIKANIPARLALQVSSQIDSRTILDTGGAEKLLGAGDMLFLSGEMSKPQRIQSAFLSETELKKVVKYLADTYESETLQELSVTSETEKNSIFDMADGDEEIDDDLYEEARMEVIRAGKASTSYIQRKLRVGYARAARLMDILEERGVIGPADGSKPREVLERAPSETDGPAGDVTENTP